MEKLSMENMKSSLASLCGELSSKRVVPFIRRVTCSGCAEGQIKARKQPAPLGLVVTQTQSAALSSFLQVPKATCVFPKLCMPVVFNVSFMIRMTLLQ